MSRAVAAQTTPVGVGVALSGGEGEGQRRTLGHKVSLNAATPGGSATHLVQGPGSLRVGPQGGVSPGRDVGGEGGTLVGIDELGGPCDVFPLGLVSSSCHRRRLGWGTVSRGRRGACTPG